MTPRTNMTKSQRKKVADDPHRTRYRDKWSRMTIGKMNADGTMTRRTVTASSGREYDRRDYSRRGKDLTGAYTASDGDQEG